MSIPEVPMLRVLAEPALARVTLFVELRAPPTLLTRMPCQERSPPSAGARGPVMPESKTATSVALGTTPPFQLLPRFSASVLLIFEISIAWAGRARSSATEPASGKRTRVLSWGIGPRVVRLDRLRGDQVAVR